MTSPTSLLDALQLLLPLVPCCVGALAVWVFSRLGADRGEGAERRVGPYRLIRRLGGGGMGEVWEARHDALERRVALKLARDPGADPTRVTRFVREARALSRLTSSHTVRVHDVGTADDGRPYYTMELLEGLDLEKLVRRHGPMPPARVLSILDQALDSLEEAHAKGLVHRDVKPANLHLGRRGGTDDHVTVLDFGLVSSSPRRPREPTLTPDGSVIGTPAYIAPESLMGGGPVDGRADVYALGCVAVFLLTGERVFAAEDVFRAAVAHVVEQPVSLRGRGHDVPPALDALVMACLEKDPRRRPDASRLRRMLRRLEIGPWTAADARAWWRSPPAEVGAPPASRGSLSATVDARPRRRSAPEAMAS